MPGIPAPVLVGALFLALCLLILGAAHLLARWIQGGPAP